MAKRDPNPKRDPTADAIATLAALKRTTDPVALAAGLTPLLADQSGYIVSRVADIAAEGGARGMLGPLVDTFSRWLKSTTSKDAGCAAKTALVRALVKLEVGYEAEESLLLGTRHTHWEAVWGGQADLAVQLRGQCVIGLAAMGSRLALSSAAELLAEADLKAAGRERVSWPARADAARALTMIGSDGAAAVLRFKALLGDTEPAVLSDCLAGLIALEPADGFALAERCLDRDDATVEAALLAIGASRRPAAFTTLRRHADRFLVDRDACATFVAAVALTRQDAAIDYLLSLIADGNSTARAAAVDALTPLRSLQRIGERLDEALARGT